MLDPATGESRSTVRARARFAGPRAVRGSSPTQVGGHQRFPPIRRSERVQPPLQVSACLYVSQHLPGPLLRFTMSSRKASGTADPGPRQRDAVHRRGAGGAGEHGAEDWRRSARDAASTVGSVSRARWGAEHDTSAGRFPERPSGRAGRVLVPPAAAGPPPRSPGRAGSPRACLTTNVGPAPVVARKTQFRRETSTIVSSSSITERGSTTPSDRR